MEQIQKAKSISIWIFIVPFLAVNLLNSEDGIAPGQACVFYSKDSFGHRVLGGGWIKE